MCASGQLHLAQEARRLLGETPKHFRVSEHQSIFRTAYADEACAALVGDKATFDGAEVGQLALLESEQVNRGPLKSLGPMQRGDLHAAPLGWGSAAALQRELSEQLIEVKARIESLEVCDCLNEGVRPLSRRSVMCRDRPSRLLRDLMGPRSSSAR